MLPQEIIRKKRDGEKLSSKDIQDFVLGITEERVTEGQVAAFCMAVLFKKMDDDERVALTMAMAHSGEMIDWHSAGIDGPILDKHSTGGVGDKVSLMLAPIIAACGGYVPMISGRGLGHTGGTLDKMDSIPGYISQPDINLLKKVVKEVGCAVVGATPEIAPADKRVYAIRDVTATVESQDLIVASILSKKLSVRLDSLVMDVKFGSGAFMSSYAEAKELAENLVAVANGAGMKTHAILTDMNQVLGRSAGNALEVIEAVKYLKNEEADYRLHEVVMALSSELLMLGGISRTREMARNKVKSVLENGKALECFAKMVAALGGDYHFIDKPESHLKQASLVRDYYPHRDGIVSEMDVRAIGVGIVEMGGGRAKATDSVDHSVGLTNVAQIGERVGQGIRPLATIHAKNQYSWGYMSKILEDSCSIVERKIIPESVIRETVV